MTDKVILVIDRPKTCLECPCYSFNAQAKRFECDVKLFLKGKIGVVELDKKPNWCPLRPLPQKKGISLKEAIGIKCSCYSDGWNECLDEITGENE